MRGASFLVAVLGLCFLPVIPATAQEKSELSFVAVSKDKTGFIFDQSGKPFIPWGFNYDHDADAGSSKTIGMTSGLLSRHTSAR